LGVLPTSFVAVYANPMVFRVLFPRMSRSVGACGGCALFSACGWVWVWVGGWVWVGVWGGGGLLEPPD
jgi:hypothetical protein